MSNKDKKSQRQPEQNKHITHRGTKRKNSTGFSREVTEDKRK